MEFKNLQHILIGAALIGGTCVIGSYGFNALQQLHLKNPDEQRITATNPTLRSNRDTLGDLLNAATATVEPERNLKPKM